MLKSKMNWVILTDNCIKVLNFKGSLGFQNFKVACLSDILIASGMKDS